MEAQQKPEGLKRLQAGVKPLQKRTVTLAPTECSATPSGFAYLPPIYRGFTPACGLNAPSGLPLRDVYKE